MLILTGQRRSEVTDAKWEEFDFAKRLWTIPAARAKNKREHDVPLSDAVLAILQSVPRVSVEWVFTISGDWPFGGHARRKERLDNIIANAAMKPRTLHDLQRTIAMTVVEAYAKARAPRASA
jgi:integrase